MEDYSEDWISPTGPGIPRGHITMIFYQYLFFGLHILYYERRRFYDDEIVDPRLVKNWL